MRRIILIAALAATALPLAAAHAGDMALKHKASQLSVPEILGGQPLVSSKAIYKDDLEHSWGFNSPNNKEILTLFVFRKTSGNASLWFDRAQSAVETNAKLGSKTALYPPRAFMPNGQGNHSAMRIVYDVSGSDYKSSGVALIPTGQWLIKLRVTSASRSAGELDIWIDQILSKIDLPSPATPEPDANAIQPCGNELKFSKNAKVVRQSPSDALVGGLLGAIVAGGLSDGPAEDGGSAAEVPPIWCRDSHAIAPSGVYRADAATDSYLLALGDSGQAVSVGLDGLGALLTGNKKVHYSVQLIMPDMVVLFAPRNGLPAPDKAFEIANTEVPVSSTSTIGDKDITINSD